VIARLATAAVAALALGLTACSVNDYCLNCALDAGSDGGGDGDAADGGDGGSPPDACVPQGVEMCNDADDDCDGRVDEEIPTVGDACGTDVGECTAGVIECTGGALRCNGVGGGPELCDNLDNNCNGQTDEGNPGGGVRCGTDVGECVAGITTCVGGAIDCVGDVGTVGGVAETCDGRDNDCDSQFDEGLGSLGTCGATGVGECQLGNLMCVGGTPTCVGDIGPTLEVCDALDQDCDGNPTNGFNLNTDPRNCGTCNRVCNLPNAVEGCAGGNCTVAACAPDFWNNNGNAADGCEYACEYQGPQEACNLVDDNCDGRIDENLTAPPICDVDGACAGTVPTCTASGWDCVYGPNVTTDAAGDIVPENRCDGIDNDCDGQVDEGHPLKGTACADSGVGVCQGRGTYVCGATPTAPVVCNITQPGGTASTELCDNLDNNCNGMVDDNAAQDWVSIGGGRQVMRWEASRPDATASDPGAVGTRVCSKGGVVPWTSVTYGQARAACQTIGADLCTEQDWHRACSVVTKSTFPLAAPAAATGFVFVEAEDYFSATTATSTGTGAGLHGWVPDSAPSDYSGISGLRASPNLGANVSQANAPTQSPRLDYQFTFPATAAATNYYVWVRMYSPVGADDTIYPGINATLPGSAGALMVTATNGTWQWVVSSAFSIPAAGGTRFVSLWMREDGVKVDMIALSRQNTTAPVVGDLRPRGGTWSYASMNTTYQLGVCNEDNFDTNGALAGDQDDVLVGGSRASCYANWGSATNRVNDLSGNVKEWTLARFPGVNPLRGGASNNEGTGITCDLAFTSANDTFFFPNVGFRCCR
jgi:hypothetical protein